MAALAIVGGVLAAVLVARARYLQQAALAERRALAVRAADELLVQWSQLPPDRFPRQADDHVPGEREMTWHTQIIAWEALQMRDLQVVRLTVEDARPGVTVPPLADVTVVVTVAPQTESQLP